MAEVATEITFTPLGDNLLVETIAAPEKSEGGVWLPDEKKFYELEEAPRAKVVRCGPGRTTQNGTLIPISVKPGDIVVYTRMSGATTKIDGKEYALISERHVLGIE